MTDSASSATSPELADALQKDRDKPVEDFLKRERDRQRNWRTLLRVPKSVNEAIQQYPNEIFLKPSSITVRNTRWRSFVKWALSDETKDKFRDEFAPLDLLEYVAQVGDIALETELETETFRIGARGDNFQEQ